MVFVVSLLAEQAEDALRTLVGNAQRLDRELLLHLQRRQTGRLAGEVGIDDVAQAFLGGVRDLLQERGLQFECPNLGTERAERRVQRRLQVRVLGVEDVLRVGRGGEGGPRQRVDRGAQVLATQGQGAAVQVRQGVDRKGVV